MAERSQAEKIGRIEATLDALKDNMEAIQQEIKTMNETLAVNTKQLEIHIEGVRLAREQNEILRDDVDSRLNSITNDIRPIQKHVLQVQTYAKVLAIMAGAPAFIYYVVLTVSKLKELL